MLAVDLAEFLASQPWRRLAACRTRPPGADWHTTTDPVAAAVAASVCCRCPVWRDCLTHALTAPETVGVWAATVNGHGRSTGGRRQMRADLAAGRPLADILDEHEARLDPVDADHLAPAVARVLGGIIRGRSGNVADRRAVFVAMGRPVPETDALAASRAAAALARREAAERAARDAAYSCRCAFCIRRKLDGRPQIPGHPDTSGRLRQWGSAPPAERAARRPHNSPGAHGYGPHNGPVTDELADR